MTLASLNGPSLQNALECITEGRHPQGRFGVLISSSRLTSRHSGAPVCFGGYGSIRRTRDSVQFHSRQNKKGLRSTQALDAFRNTGG